MKSLWKVGLRWMKRQRWDLRGRKWEQVNVPQILFLSKQDVLWCFIYKATKAQNAEGAHLAAKSTVRGSGSGDRKRGWETERGRGDGWSCIPSARGGEEEEDAWTVTDKTGRKSKWLKTKTRQEHCGGTERSEQRGEEGVEGVQCGTAVVTVANAAWCDVTLAAVLSPTLTG